MCVCVNPSVPAVTAQRLQCDELTSFLDFDSWICKLNLCSQVMATVEVATVEVALFPGRELTQKITLRIANYRPGAEEVGHDC